MKNKIFIKLFSIFLLFSCTTYKFGQLTNNYLIDESTDLNKDVHEFDLSYTYKIMGIPVKGDKAIVEDTFIHPDNKTMFLIISFPRVGILKTEDNGRTFTSNYFKSSFLDSTFGYNNENIEEKNSKIKSKKAISPRLFGHFAFSKNDKDKLIIAFGPYIFISTDRGEKWKMKSLFYDLEKTNIKDVFVTDDDKLIVMTENTIAISEDWGLRWKKQTIAIDKVLAYKIEYVCGLYDNKTGYLYSSIKYKEDPEEILSKNTYNYFYNNIKVNTVSGLYYSKDLGKTWLRSEVPVPVFLWKYSDKIYAAPLYPLCFYKYNFEESFKDSPLYKRAKLDESVKNAQELAKVFLNLKPEEYDILSNVNNKILSFNDVEKDLKVIDETDFENLYIAINKIQKLQNIQWENYWYEDKKSANFNYEYNLYKFFKLWTGYRTNSPVLYTKDEKKKIYYRIKPDPLFLKTFIYYSIQNQIRLNSIKPFLRKTTDIEFYDPTIDPTNGFPVVIEFSKDKGKSWEVLIDSKHVRAIIDPLNTKRSGFYWYKNVDQKKIAKLQISFGWVEGVNYLIYPIDLYYFNNQLFIKINYFSVAKSYKDLYVIPLNN
jgi:hypothetical protein